MSLIDPGDEQIQDARISAYGKLCNTLARHYAGKDWHKLSIRERRIVRMLEKNERLSVNNPPDGFVGKFRRRR